MNEEETVTWPEYTKIMASECLSIEREIKKYFNSALYDYSPEEKEQYIKAYSLALRCLSRKMSPQALNFHMN